MNYFAVKIIILSLCYNIHLVVIIDLGTPGLFIYFGGPKIINRKKFVSHAKLLIEITMLV